MNKTVLITGGSRGIGKATAIEFAKNNYNVVINYVSNDEAAESLKSFIVENYDVDVMLSKCDVSDEEGIKKMVSNIIEKYGKIDVLVNNAGIAIDTTFEDKTVENFRRTLDVNLIGAFIVAKEVGKHMLENKSGNIVNVASNDGLEAYYPMSLDYDASKAGMISLTHNLAVFYAPYIRVNAVAPGWVKTDMNKELDDEFIKEALKNIFLDRFCEPEEVAKVIYFLASDSASFVNNEVIRIDGGNYHA